MDHHDLVPNISMSFGCDPCYLKQMKITLDRKFCLFLLEYWHVFSQTITLLLTIRRKKGDLCVAIFNRYKIMVFDKS